MSAPVAIVIPNLNGAHWLTGCLRSLSAQTLPATEIIVADDGSIDDSAAVCAAFGAHFLPGDGPPRSGFAATVSRGIAATNADVEWIMLLNNDVEADPNFLGALIAGALRHPNCGVLAPLVRSLRDRSRIDSAGLLLYPDGVARPRWHGERVDAHRMREEQILLPSGTAVMIRRTTFERVGPLDLALDSYLEDVDWGLRAARSGVVTVFIPDAVVDHHFSGTFGETSPAKAMLVERNRMVVAARHLPLTMLLTSPWWTLRRWRALSSADAGSTPGVRRAALGGVVRGLTALPKSSRERRSLRHQGLTLDREWRAHLRQHACGPDAFSHFGGQ